MAAAAIGLLVLDDYSYGELLYEAPSIEVALAFPLVGALVAARRPRNPIGWILCAAGFTQGVVELTYLYARHSYVMDPGSLPGADIAAWLSTWTWIPGFGMLLTFLPLLFPSGTLLSPRWRPVAWLSGACIGAMVLLTAASKWAGRGSGLLGDVDEDIRWFTPLLLMLLGCGVASTISLILRFIRSRGVERQQVKWLAFALASLVLIFLADAFQPGGVTAFVALVIIPCGDWPGNPALSPLRHRSHHQPHACLRFAYGNAWVGLRSHFFRSHGIRFEYRAVAVRRRRCGGNPRRCGGLPAGAPQNPVVHRSPLLSNPIRFSPDRREFQRPSACQGRSRFPHRRPAGDGRPHGPTRARIPVAEGQRSSRVRCATPHPLGP